MSKPLAVGLVCLLVVAALAGAIVVWNQEPEKPENGGQDSERTRARIEAKLSVARELLQQANYIQARSVADQILELDANQTDALLIAGQSAAEQQEAEAALRYFSRITPGDTPEAVTALYGIGAVHFYLGSFAKAEPAFRQVLEYRPKHPLANDRLSELLDLQGRRWDSLPYAFELVRQRKATLQSLVLLADPSLVVRRTEKARQARDRDPDDTATLLGIARAQIYEGHKAEAEKLIRQVIDRRPDLLEARVRLGELLVDGADEPFLKWLTALPREADRYPDLWMFRGKWLRRHQRLPEAGRCFLETLRRNPHDRAAHYQLGRVLISMKREQDAQPFLARSAALTDLDRLLTSINSAGDQARPSQLKAFATALRGMGRTLEADNWDAEADLRSGVKPAAATPPLRPANHAELVSMWLADDLNPVKKTDLSDLPLPVFDVSSSGTAGGSFDAQLAAHFDNVAGDLNVRFQFVAAPDESTEGKRIVELTGGGVAAFDFDLDNRPDLYFTQGGLLPQVDGHTDRLFRNLDQEFADITDVAGLHCPRFGQGVTAGDFDADGFPDLYVNNLGANQLFRNNGDGTFVEVTDAFPAIREDWTTSAAMVDLNSDGLSDLYVANYLEGEQIHSLICRPNSDAKPRVCSPDVFDSAQDRLYLNNGDGTFSDHTREGGIVVPDGKGLGVLVADFEETGSVQVFVANDGVPNFYFDRTDDSPTPTFEETALAVGVAISGDSEAQACMGIASADADSDGVLDFFVTNFEKESNTLYAGRGGGFEDTTRQAKLREPSYRLLGFGTQFVDGELDGLPDLVITNGHVDDFTDTGSLHEMRAQYLRNTGKGVFQERFAGDVGAFFAVEQLGRGMCRLDINRDGRNDLAVSHLDQPAAILANTSKKTGHYLTVKLVGTSISRDAHRTTVRVRNGDWTRMEQLTAGDGYQCTNERQLNFGLGQHNRIEQLEVRWSNGQVQTFRDIAADQEIIVIEGDSVPRTLPPR